MFHVEHKICVQFANKTFLLLTDNYKNVSRGTSKVCGLLFPGK